MYLFYLSCIQIHISYALSSADTLQMGSQVCSSKGLRVRKVSAYAIDNPLGKNCALLPAILITYGTNYKVIMEFKANSEDLIVISLLSTQIFYS